MGAAWPRLGALRPALLCASATTVSISSLDAQGFLHERGGMRLCRHSFCHWIAVSTLGTRHQQTDAGSVVFSGKSNPDCIVLFSISPQSFCYLLRVYNSVFMRL